MATPKHLVKPLPQPTRNQVGISKIHLIQFMRIPYLFDLGGTENK